MRRYLAREPVSAHRSSVVYRTTKLLRRHAAASVGVAAVALALMAATAFSLHQMQDARRQRDAAVFAGKQAAAQNEFLSVLMGQLGPTPLTMRDLVDRARVAVERQPIGDARVRVWQLVQLSERYGDLEETKFRGQLLDQADSLALANGYRTELAEVRCNRADNLRNQGRYAAARTLLASADSLLGPHPDPATEVTCLHTRADLQVEAGPAQGAVALMQRAIGIRDSLGVTGDLGYIDLLADYAEALDEEGQHREAIAVHSRVNALFDSAGLGTTMTSVINEHDMALALFKLGETAQSERLFHDAVDRAARSDPLGRLPEQLLIHMAHAALFQRHYDTADKYFGMLAAEGVADTNAYWQGRALFGLAESQIGAGYLADARRTMARFRPMSTNRALGSSDDHIVDYRILEAQLAGATGQSAVARRLVTDALRTAGYFAGKRKMIFRSTLVFAAELALSNGDPRSAATLARDAREVATGDSLTLRRSAFVGEAQLVEGRALLASGDTAGARSVLEQASAGLETGAGADHPRTREARTLLATVAGTTH